MTTPGLTHRFMFGIRGDLPFNVSYVDESIVSYVAGHNVVLYDTLERKQKFIHGSEKVELITASAVCAHRKYVAVAERGDSAATICIYNLRTLRKFKNLQWDKWATKDVVHMSFSADNQLLLTLGGAPDWTLVCWNWNKSKAVSYIQVSMGSPLNQCSFSPLDASVVCCSGDGILKFYRVLESELRAIPASSLTTTLTAKDGVMRPGEKPKDAFVTCHCWLKAPEDHMVMGTDDGALVLYEKSSFLCTLSVSPKFVVDAQGGAGDHARGGFDHHSRGNAASSPTMGDSGGEGGSGAGGYAASSSSPSHSSSSSSNNVRIDSLVAVSKGFLAGCVNATVRLYNLVADRPRDPANMFQCIQTWQIPNHHLSTIASMSLTPNEDCLAAVLSENQLYQLNISSPLTVKSEDVRPITGSINHGPGAVTGLDLCVRKPLAVTCGLDRTVRVWNYLDCKLELSKSFNEDPYSVAFHPSGLHIMVGFADKLRLMNLLMDDIRPFREVSIKMCRECQFSRGGQYFAAVNGYVISVYDFYSGEKVADMRGHNSKVRGLYWSADDATLISCGQDGAVYQWNVEKCTRTGEYVQKGTMYNCAIGNGSFIWAVGTDHLLKELELPDLNPVKELDGGVNLGQIVLSNGEHLLFASTAADRKPGNVRAYAFPLTGEYLEYPCMGGPITRLRISHNDQHLIVTDETGCVCLFGVKDKQEKRGLTNKEGGAVGGGQFAWSEEILVTKSDLDEKHALMQELKNKVDELALHNEYQLRLKDMNYSEKIKEVTEKFTQDLEQDKNKYDLLREEKNDMEMEYEERIKQMDEKHQHELQELEGAYQQKIMSEVERYQQLVHERDLQKDRWEEQQELLVGTHDKYVGELTEDFEQKLDEDKQLRMTYEDEKNELQKEFDEIKTQLEDDIDTEIQILRTKYDQQLAAEREATLRFKGENGIMKKKFTVLQKDIEDQKEEIKLLLEKEKELHEQIKALEREIQSHKREIKSRDDTIGEKEKKIYELKKKNQELEKFKFVLDYKIKELKRQIEPRETEISNMKNQIKDMDRELEQFHKSNAQLDLMIGELRSKLDAMQKDILSNRKIIGDQESLMRRCKSELHDCAQFIQDPDALKDRISKLYQQHVQKKDLPKNEVDVNVQNEYQRHQQFLEKTLQTLKIKFAKDVKMHKQMNLKLMEENITIIHEISKQREGNKMSKQILQQKLGDYKLRLSKQQGRAGSAAGDTPFTPSPRVSEGGMDAAAAAHAFEANKSKIAQLREEVKELEAKIVSSRPFSRELLPPVR